MLTRCGIAGIPSQMWRSYRYHCLILLLCSTVVYEPQTACSENSFEETRSYFDGLRQRRLFMVAETVCLRKLNARRLSVSEKAWYTVELSRTFAAHAVFASSIDEEQELLARARRIPEALLEQKTNHPQRPLLLAQSLFVAAGEVETLRLRLAVTPFADELRARALKTAQQTIPSLQELDEEIRSELRRASRDVLGERLKLFQLRGLQRVVRFQLATLMFNRSLLLPAGSADRAEALTAADGLFRRLAAGEPGVMVTWQSQIGLVQTNRLRGDVDAALRLINALEKDDPPAGIMDEVIAEKIELLHEERKFASALEALRQHGGVRNQLSGRLTWLLARTLLDLQNLARDRHEPELAQSLLQDFAACATRAQADPGGYWGERCRLLLATAHAASTYGPALGPVVQRAQVEFAAGRVTESTQLYAEAFQAACEAKPENLKVAVDVGYTLASLLLKTDQPERAVQVFGTIVELLPDGDRTAQADLMRAYCLGVLYRRETTKSRREAYTTALNSHRTRFGRSPTCHEATWYLAQLEERRLQMTAALRLYRTVPIMHPRGEAAQVAFARCSEAILKRQRQLNRPAREWETAIEGWLSEATKPLLDPEATLSRTQAELLLYAARIRLTQSQPDFLKADLCLNRILNALDDVSARDTGTQTDRTLLPDQIAMASQLRIVSLAGAGQVTEAAAILSQASNRGPEELLLLLDGLSAATAGQSETVSRELGRLQLDVLHRSGVDVATLPDAQRIPFLLRIGEASELAGRITEAAETYARLLRERPDSDSIRLNLARLRSSLPGRLDQEQATALWQTIESKNKAGSDQWLLARLEVIRCHIRLGETGIAGKLLTVTQLLYRNAGTPDIRRRYMEVEQQLAAAVRK